MSEMHVDHVILLVDDDADDREFIEHVLLKAGTGHKIMEAINGEDCLEKLRSLIEIHELPCLIILDLNMPKLDGKQTLSAIRADRRLNKVPVIIFSTAPNDRDRDFFKDHNAEYIMKPLEYKAFFPIAERMLNRCNVHSDSQK